jgi:hypothetical protein
MKLHTTRANLERVRERAIAFSVLSYAMRLQPKMGDNC